MSPDPNRSQLGEKRTSIQPWGSGGKARVFFYGRSKPKERNRTNSKTKLQGGKREFLNE